MRKILITIITLPLIYLAIAIVLISIPFERNTPEKTLDFDTIKEEGFPIHLASENSYTTRNGSELFYRNIDGSSDITLVLLHGSGSEGRYLLSMASSLNSKFKISVVVPDLRGHGRSQGELSGDIQYMGQFEHDLEDLLNHLKLSNPDEKIVIGGHSSGGGLVVKYGGNTLKQFNGAILLAPYLGHQSPTVRPSSGGWVQVASLRYVGLIMLNNIGITYLNSQHVLFFNRPEGLTDNLQVDSYSYTLNESFAPQTYEEDLSNNKTPMLLLVGAEDEAFYPQEYKGIMDSYAPHAEVHILKKIKHLDLTSSDKAATLILNWLEKTYNKSSKRDAVIDAPS